MSTASELTICVSWTDDVRLEVATELLRLTEASGIFDECATFGEHGKIAFELGEAATL